MNRQRILIGLPLLVVVAIVVALLAVRGSDDGADARARPDDSMVAVGPITITRVEHETFLDEMGADQAVNEKERLAYQLNAISSYVVQAERQELMKELGVEVSDAAILAEMRRRVPPDCVDDLACVFSPMSFRIGIETELYEKAIMRALKADADYQPTDAEIERAIRVHGLTKNSGTEKQLREAAANWVRAENWIRAEPTRQKRMRKLFADATVIGELRGVGRELQRIYDETLDFPPLPYDPPHAEDPSPPDDVPPPKSEPPRVVR